MNNGLFGLPRRSLDESATSKNILGLTDWATNTGMHPVPLGSFWAEQGGYYFGKVKYPDGSIYALISAPKAQGENASIQWKTTSDATTGTDSFYDGWANTMAMLNTAFHPLAAWVRGLVINGFSDWYIGARDENQQRYEIFKPNTTATNVTLRPDSNGYMGENLYSIPIGTGYRYEPVSVTVLDVFKTGGTEAFDVSVPYWDSTQYAPDARYAWYQYFSDGQQHYPSYNYAKSNNLRARAIRKVKLN